MTGVDDADCEISLTLSKNHYTDKTHTYTFTVAKGDIVVAGADTAAKWGSYTSSPQSGNHRHRSRHRHHYADRRGD